MSRSRLDGRGRGASALGRVSLGAMLATLVGWAPACANVLGLDDFENAVAALCKCDSVVPRFGGACESVLNERLDQVSPQAREAWLDFYAENCAGSCERAFECYQQDATCSFNACNEVAEECCAYVDGVQCAENDLGEKVCVYPDENGT